MRVCILSCVQLGVTLWIATWKAPLSMGFSREEYWSGLLCPSPEDLPNLGSEPTCLMFPALASGFFTTSTIWKAIYISVYAYVNIYTYITSYL